MHISDIKLAYWEITYYTTYLRRASCPKERRKHTSKKGEKVYVDELGNSYKTWNTSIYWHEKLVNTS